MAEETLVGVRMPFFDAIGQIVQALDNKYGPLYAAILMRFRDKPYDNWTLLLGSRRLVDQESEGMLEIATRLAEDLPEPYRAYVRTIGILKEDDPFFRALTLMIQVRIGSVGFLNNTTLDGIDLDQAVVYVAQPQLNGPGDRRHGRSRGTGLVTPRKARRAPAHTGSRPRT